MAITAQGTTIEISSDGVAYTSLGCIESFSMDGNARAEIDVTCLTSTSKEFMFGLRDNGTMALEIKYDPSSAGLTLAEASYASDTAYKFRVTYNDQITPTTGNPTSSDFDGFVMNLSHSGSVDNVLTGSIEVKISGDVTTTPAT
jgi:hypothetical protein